MSLAHRCYVNFRVDDHPNPAFHGATRSIEGRLAVEKYDVVIVGSGFGALAAAKSHALKLGLEQLPPVVLGNQQGDRTVIVYFVFRESIFQARLLKKEIIQRGNKIKSFSRLWQQYFVNHYKCVFCPKQRKICTLQRYIMDFIV